MPAKKASNAVAPAPGTAIYTKGKQKVQEILVTATDVLAYEGYSAFTMRNIASRLNITLRNLQYYFKTKQDLFQAVVERMITLEQRTAKQATAIPDLSPEARFCSFIDYSIIDNESDLIRGFQFELWALATRDEFAAKCRDQMTSAYCSYIHDLISPLTPQLSQQQQLHKSALILAMLQGIPLIHSQGVDRKYLIDNISKRVKEEAFRMLDLQAPDSKPS